MDDGKNTLHNKNDEEAVCRLPSYALRTRHCSSGPTWL